MSTTTHARQPNFVNSIFKSQQDKLDRTKGPQSTHIEDSTMQNSSIYPNQNSGFMGEKSYESVEGFLGNSNGVDSSGLPSPAKIKGHKLPQLHPKGSRNVYMTKKVLQISPTSLIQVGGDNSQRNPFTLHTDRQKVDSSLGLSPEIVGHGINQTSKYSN